MENVTLREAVAEDVDALLHLYLEANLGDPSFTPDEAAAHLAALKRYPNFRVFVACLGDQVVGTYELLIMDNMAKRGRRSAIVEDVAVHPAYRGRGIGRAIMEHAMQLSRNADCYKLLLSSNLRREEAHRFYESLGFEKHGYSFRIKL